MATRTDDIPRGEPLAAVPAGPGLSPPAPIVTVGDEVWRSAIAAVLNVCSTFPLHKIAFRQQVDGVSFAMASRQVWREGARMLWRGMAPPLLQRATSIAVMFGSFRFYADSLTERGFDPLLASAVAGAASGASESLLMPFERVQTILQHRNWNQRVRGMGHCARLLLAHGVSEFYRGFLPVLLRCMGSSSLFFMLRGPLKDALLSIRDASWLAVGPPAPVCTCSARCQRYGAPPVLQPGDRRTASGSLAARTRFSSPMHMHVGDVVEQTPVPPPPPSPVLGQPWRGSAGGGSGSGGYCSCPVHLCASMPAVSRTGGSGARSAGGSPRGYSHKSGTSSSKNGKATTGGTAGATGNGQEEAALSEQWGFDAEGEYVLASASAGGPALDWSEDEQFFRVSAAREQLEADRRELRHHMQHHHRRPPEAGAAASTVGGGESGAVPADGLQPARPSTHDVVVDGPPSGQPSSSAERAQEESARPLSQRAHFVADFVSGGLLGASIGALLYPISVAKTLMQSTIGPPSSTVHRRFSSTLAQLLRERGLRGIMAGAGTNFSRSLLSWGLMNAAMGLMTPESLGLPSQWGAAVAAAWAGDRRAGHWSDETVPVSGPGSAAATAAAAAGAVQPYREVAADQALAVEPQAVDTLAEGSVAADLVQQPSDGSEVMRASAAAAAALEASVAEDVAALAKQERRLQKLRWKRAMQVANSQFW